MFPRRDCLAVVRAVWCTPPANHPRARLKSTSPSKLHFAIALLSLSEFAVIQPLLGMFSPGPLELAIIAGILLLLFGNRLPSLMRSLGRSVVEFKKGVNDPDEPQESVENKNK